ncbi:MAG: hypothetical protein AAF384_04855 [Pseudomonadota bacterium]
MLAVAVTAAFSGQAHSEKTIPVAIDKLYAMPAQPAVTRDYLVIGSFDNQKNASAWAARNELLDALVYVNGKSFRVVIGPLDPVETPILKMILGEIGIQGSWRMALCVTAEGLAESCHHPRADGGLASLTHDFE